MERVKKGEMYWYITSYGWVTPIVDNRTDFDNAQYKYGNYFHTEEAAKVVKHKLHAVLKGADVIEMPSEEEIKNAQKHIEDEVVFNIRTEGQQLIYCKAINKGAELMANWLKSKIVK